MTKRIPEDQKQVHAHGMYYTRVYRIWHGMKMRCESPRSTSYRYYGAKGVRVCDRWAKFQNFFADMGEPPTQRHTLDRYPNTRGNYEPTNCRWALPVDQIEGRSIVRTATYQGVTRPLARWAESLGLNYDTVIHRLNRGWSVERAFTEPIHAKRATASP